MPLYMQYPRQSGSDTPPTQDKRVPGGQSPEQVQPIKMSHIIFQAKAHAACLPDILKQSDRAKDWWIS